MIDGKCPHSHPDPGGHSDTCSAQVRGPKGDRQELPITQKIGGECAGGGSAAYYTKDRQQVYMWLRGRSTRELPITPKIDDKCISVGEGCVRASDRHGSHLRH